MLEVIISFNLYDKNIKKFAVMLRDLKVPLKSAGIKKAG